jgi:hypothetical protein
MKERGKEPEKRNNEEEEIRKERRGLTIITYNL